jgi:NADH:ubiquinone oxidoreductase subunit 5 (subunit L)/multisubunit Na+/H+ antiporter MnhA subunit
MFLLVLSIINRSHKNYMYLLVLFCPLIACIFSLFFGRFIGSKGVSFMTTFSLFISLICSLFIFYEVGLSGSTCIIKLYKWVDLGYFFVDIVFFFDVVTCVMLVVVTFISFLVHMYSIEYMGYDPCLNRFMSYLSLFTFFMLLLVTADNFIQMFIG